MAKNAQVIELYTELAEHPEKDFGWEKGFGNARAHGYKKEWMEALPETIWHYCAAVGNPFKDAIITEGDTVLDLGCGAGVDVLVARLHVGGQGKVHGVDITPKMVEVARKHVVMAGFENVEIEQCGFDAVGLENESVDVVISNGAINLTECKESVFAEIYRVLKPGGKLYFADMIDITEPTCCSAERNSCCEGSGEEEWANCVAGTIREAELVALIQKAGFEAVECTGHTHYMTAETTRGATFRASKVTNELRRAVHWDTVFATKDYTQVLWHQDVPEFSLLQTEKYVKHKCDAIIDVGCGAAYFVDELIEQGYTDITLLDVSKNALEIVKDRVGDAADGIKCICTDITAFKSGKTYALWHDRAVFHFLQDENERKQYFEIMKETLDENGTALIGTFSENGPDRCSDLDVVQYDSEKMRSALIEGLVLRESIEIIHTTPKQSTQSFRFFVIEKIVRV